MKKRFTLILASMLLAMGAWAETTVYKVNEATTTLTDGTYVLVAMSDNGTGPCYYSSEESGNRLYRYDVNKEVQVGGYIDGAQYIWTIDETTTNGTQKITVTNVGDPTKAFPVDAAKNNNFQGSGAAELIPELHTINGVDYLALKLEDASVGYIHANAPGGNPNLSYWDSYADGGTCVKFRFYPVEAAVVADRTITYTLTDMAGNSYEGTFEGHEGDVPAFTGVADYSLDNIQWSENSLTATITFPFAVSSANVTNATMITNGASWTSNAKKKWRAVDVDGTNYVKAMTADSELASISNWLWAIYPQLSNGKFTFTIKNLATNTYVCANPESAADVQGTNKPVSLAAEGTAFTYEQRNGQYCNFAYVNNEGTRLVLSINGSGDTNVFLGVYGGSHNGNDIGFPSVIETTVFPFPISEEGEENWTFMTSSEMSTGTGYFYVNNDGKIVSMSTINANGLSYLPTVETLTKWQWAIYPTFENGCFTFKIKNAATDKYVPKTANGNGEIFITTEAESANFSWATCVGNAYGFLLENTTNVFLSVNSSAKDEQKCILWTKPASTSHVGANIKFLDSHYTVTVGSTGYSTLYTPIKVAVPEGITAYTGELNGEWLTLTEIENVIPANTAVVLQGDANTYTFNASSAEATEIENNDLTGSTETVATSSVEGTVYTLQSHNGGVAFKRYTGTNLTGFKAYLAVENQAQAIRIRKGSEEGTTSIDNAQLTMDNENVVIYDLQGRRVEKMEKGIYIVNGKKIIK